VDIKTRNLRTPVAIANCLITLGVLLTIATEGEGLGGLVAFALVLALLVANCAVLYVEIRQSAEERELERKIRVTELRKRLKDLENVERT
jgi:hypothetical protein